MSITAIRGQQILNGSVQRADMNTSTAGAAVITKVINGSGITLSSTGMDSGTGDVTVSASVFGGFITKSAAYTLSVSDSGKYFICSGGSWTLTLPAPASGLAYQVRNDQGITGTTGTITITPTSGTIDGLASLPLLAGQECLIITDGTNWRTFGRQRNVVIGTQDITTSTASAFFLLPPGYRHYELTWDEFQSTVDNANIVLNLSNDGGNTWQTGSTYGRTLIYNSSATAVTAFSSTTDNSGQIASGTQLGAANALGSLYSLTFNPGNGTTVMPHWQFRTSSYSNTNAYTINQFGYGWFSLSSFMANAIRYVMSSGNIALSQLTVKGVV